MPEPQETFREGEDIPAGNFRESISEGKFNLCCREVKNFLEYKSWKVFCTDYLGLKVSWLICTVSLSMLAWEKVPF